MNGIADWLTKYRKEVVLFILFFLISSTSFALGYLAARESATPQVVIEKVQKI